MFDRPERPGESSRTGKTALHGCLGDGDVGIDQQGLGPGDALMVQIFAVVHPHKLFEQPIKMKLTESDISGHRFQGRRFQAVGTDISQAISIFSR